jgi:hypothetical protein
MSDYNDKFVRSIKERCLSRILTELPDNRGCRLTFKFKDHMVVLNYSNDDRKGFAEVVSVDSILYDEPKTLSDIINNPWGVDHEVKKILLKLSSSPIDAQKVFDGFKGKWDTIESSEIPDWPRGRRYCMSFGGECLVFDYYSDSWKGFLDVVSVGDIKFDDQVSLHEILNSPENESQLAAKEKIVSLHKRFYKNLPYKE